jgi:catechol 2,3-dioxygenase-like lactoylglutathione lyase family enzyme
MPTFRSDRKSARFVSRWIRRRRVAPEVVALLLRIFALFLAAHLAAQIAPMGTGPIIITVSDLDRSIAFYTDVLSFRQIGSRHSQLDSLDRLTGIFGTNASMATLQLGSETIELVEYHTPRGRPVPADSRSNDGWFQHLAIVVTDMDAGSARLQEHKVKQISTSPQTLPEWNQSAAGIKAFYFRDPDDHPLELIFFPPAKGDRRWHERAAPSASPFLGIDHTAIAVANTERSLSFYRDVLGFRVTGESLNYGVEQDHLNHIFGSKVQITSLRSSNSPGIELLEYISPRNARPMPTDATPADLWCVATTVIVPDLTTAVAAFSRGHIEFISTEPQDIMPFGEKDAKGILVRDPDGHMVLVRSRPESRGGQ